MLKRGAKISIKNLSIKKVIISSDIPTKIFKQDAQFYFKKLGVIF